MLSAAVLLPAARRADRLNSAHCPIPVVDSADGLVDIIVDCWIQELRATEMSGQEDERRSEAVQLGNVVQSA